MSHVLCLWSVFDRFSVSPFLRFTLLSSAINCLWSLVSCLMSHVLCLWSVFDRFPDTPILFAGLSLRLPFLFFHLPFMVSCLRSHVSGLWSAFLRFSVSPFHYSVLPHHQHFPRKCLASCRESVKIYSTRISLRI